MLGGRGLQHELTAELFRDGLPLDTFDRLRRELPVFETNLPDGTRAWNLVRYNDVISVLVSWRDYGVLPSIIHVEPEAETEPNPEPWCLKAAMAMNPPDHALHKQKLAPMMKPELIESFRPTVKKVAEHVTQSVREKRNADAIQDFAAPAATAIVSEYLGIHPANRDYARRLSADFMGDSLLPPSIGAYRHLRLGPRALNAVHGSPMRAATELIYESWGHAPWFDEAFVKRAGRWEVEELTLQALTAGIAGLRNCIATAVLCLAPQWHAAKSQSETWLDRVSLIADEVMRHATPLLRVRRILSGDAIWYGTKMHAGDTLLVWLASANFDPARFHEPNAFQPFRTPNPHVSFSTGLHHCLGAPLARMELEEIIRAMLEMWTSLELRAAPIRFTSNIVNDFEELLFHVT
jgi:cytochrome P450